MTSCAHTYIHGRESASTERIWEEEDERRKVKEGGGGGGVDKEVMFFSKVNLNSSVNPRMVAVESCERTRTFFPFFFFHFFFFFFF